MGFELRRSNANDLDGIFKSLEAAFGWPPIPSDIAERAMETYDWNRTYVAEDGGKIVATAGAYAFDLSVPGGRTGCAGITRVGVAPTHRRQGFLSTVMPKLFDDAISAGENVAYLWASEDAIYQRFGYGRPAILEQMEFDPRTLTFLSDPGPHGTTELIDPHEDLGRIDRIYERAMDRIPGMFGRSEPWWRGRSLRDDSQARGSKSSLRCAIWTDGEDEAYALYRVQSSFEHGIPNGTLDINEVVALTTTATREMWRFLMAHDLIDRIKSRFVQREHPLLSMVSDPTRIKRRVSANLWLRILDIPKALVDRSYLGDGRLVFEVTGADVSRWMIEVEEGEAKVAPTEADPDIRLDIAALSALYLGDFGLTQLADSGRIELVTQGALRADNLFRWSVSPWCPEIF